MSVHTLNMDVPTQEGDMKSPLDMTTMGASLPSPSSVQEQMKEFNTVVAETMRGPPPPYPSIVQPVQQHQQPPSITVTMAGGSRTSPSLFSTSPSQQQQRYRHNGGGLDPELEFLLDSDPGLMEMKSKSFCDFAPQQQQSTQQPQPWYSLPTAMEYQQPRPQEQHQLNNIVENPNVVETVKSQVPPPSER